MHEHDTAPSNDDARHAPTILVLVLIIPVSAGSNCATAARHAFVGHRHFVGCRLRPRLGQDLHTHTDHPSSQLHTAASVTHLRTHERVVDGLPLSAPGDMSVRTCASQPSVVGLRDAMRCAFAAMNGCHSPQNMVATRPLRPCPAVPLGPPPRVAALARSTFCHLAPYNSQCTMAHRRSDVCVVHAELSDLSTSLLTSAVSATAFLANFVLGGSLGC